jgi:hypothetical protein
MTEPTPTRRSFRPTPAWLIFGLLVVEGLLWLSERYRWLWFNEKKGWTVLIAVAVVGAAMLVMLCWFLVSLIVRWRFQFSIRSLLVLTIAIALPCSWFGARVQEEKREREAAAEIENSGADVTWSGPTLPAWLRGLLGDAFDKSVLSVDIPDIIVSESDLEAIKRLSEVHELDLRNTRVTDADLVQFNGLNHLEELSLDRTEVTDAGLEKLKGLNHLKSLDLGNTGVTDEGVKKLQQVLPNCKIEH